MTQETFESFATDYIAEKSDRAREYGMVYQALKQGANWQKERNKELITKIYADAYDEFARGVNWQREQHKELIEELLESLKTVTKIPIYRREFGNGSIDLKAQHAIAKAENYLKQ